MIERLKSGDIRLAARLMRFVDDRAEGYVEYMREVWSNVGKAHIIGVTGAPGSGKSTLTDKLIKAFREDGKSVGVVAIDPTSPFSGGAILGDRVRMTEHSVDEGVFIRSVGTRGHLGGLSVSTMDIVAVMDAMGKDIIIIETVGVGQDEVEIAQVSDTCIVVTVPGMGDDIQAIKAGIFEIADIFVVNKCDREGSERTTRDLEMMLEMVPSKSSWKVDVMKTIAAKGDGVPELVSKIKEHNMYYNSELKAKKMQERLVHVAYGAVKEKLVNEIFTIDKLKSLLNKGLDPYSVVDEIWSKYSTK